MNLILGHSDKNGEILKLNFYKKMDREEKKSIIEVAVLEFETERQNLKEEKYGLTHKLLSDEETNKEIRVLKQRLLWYKDKDLLAEMVYFKSFPRQIQCQLTEESDADFKRRVKEEWEMVDAEVKKSLMRYATLRTIISTSRALPNYIGHTA